MKLHHYLFSTFALLLLLSCTKETTHLSESPTTLPDFSTKTAHSQCDIDSLYYYTDGNCWIRPFTDPYIITEDDLAGGKTPTHYAVSFYPKNEIEVNRLMSIDGARISYVPFGYEAVHESEIPNSVKDQLDRRSFTKQSVKNSQLPVFYLVWPVGLDFPKDLDYRIEYLAILPNYSEGSNIGNSKGRSYRILDGTISNTDSMFGSSLPVSNLKIRIQYGLDIIDRYTGSNGYYTISGNINDNASVYIVYENDRWRLSRKGSMFTYSWLLGKVKDLWPTSSSSYSPVFTNTYLTVHRAANYFFHGTNSVTVPTCNYAIRINMNESTLLGETYFQVPLGSPYIEMSDFWASFSGNQVFATMHELSHFYHYLTKGNYSSYNAVNSVIKDSFADFLAWYISRNYYTYENGGVYDSAWNSSLGGGKQFWNHLDTTYENRYTPVFIDLIDNYNQYYELGAQYNNDPISAVPLNVVINMSMQNDNWSSLKAALSGKIGQYYTLGDYNTFVSPYDYYFSML